jgi:hypothetical protein
MGNKDARRREKKKPKQTTPKLKPNANPIIFRTPPQEPPKPKPETN